MIINNEKVEEIEDRNVVENVVENHRHCRRLQFSTTFNGYEPRLQAEKM